MIPTLTLHEGDTLHLRSAKQGGRHEALMGKKKKKKKNRSNPLGYIPETNTTV